MHGPETQCLGGGHERHSEPYDATGRRFGRPRQQKGGDRQRQRRAIPEDPAAKTRESIGFRRGSLGGCRGAAHGAAGSIPARQARRCIVEIAGCKHTYKYCYNLELGLIRSHIVMSSSAPLSSVAESTAGSVLGLIG